MDKHSSIEDSIFVLSMKIRVIRDTITLNADGDLFLTKTLDDVQFINQTMKALLEYLRDTRQLPDRDGLLECFSELEWQFSQTLSVLLGHRGNLSVQDSPTLREKLQIFQSSCVERQRLIETLLPARPGQGSAPVSPHEMDELFKVIKPG